MDWGSMIGGIGIGGIIASVLTPYFNGRESQKERIFNKKEAAYNGLLDALYASQIEPSYASASKIGHWHNRIMFVGSPDVIKFNQILMDSTPGTPERTLALKNLFTAIRNDLKIDIREFD